MEYNALWVKNAPSEFQNMTNVIFSPQKNFSIVYIDDILAFTIIADPQISGISS